MNFDTPILPLRHHPPELRKQITPHTEIVHLGILRTSNANIEKMRAAFAALRRRTRAPSPPAP